jgi:hypothetical protein
MQDRRSDRGKLMGHPVQSIIVFAPASGSMALSFTLFSYAGELRLGVEADASLDVQPQALAAAFDEALQELESWAPGSAIAASAHLPTGAKHA